MTGSAQITANYTFEQVEAARQLVWLHDCGVTTQRENVIAELRCIATVSDIPDARRDNDGWRIGYGSNEGYRSLGLQLPDSLECYSL